MGTCPRCIFPWFKSRKDFWHDDLFRRNSHYFTAPPDDNWTASLFVFGDVLSNS